MRETGASRTPSPDSTTAATGPHIDAERASPAEKEAKMGNNLMTFGPGCTSGGDNGGCAASPARTHGYGSQAGRGTAA
ncbi:hypothetical protein CCHR01_17889 [Colletotrichum chrysophilum]|uniref:Uncharacterized protein n=1 Tax=Colletotrichum chrysophilum TaxID=1836956 RepID=A0AAD9A145_9PEZI|nr:hypothetical protein CCHR01_17889 [Colletotrichum chrysophilum]